MLFQTHVYILFNSAFPKTNQHVVSKPSLLSSLRAGRVLVFSRSSGIYAEMNTLENDAPTKFQHSRSFLFLEEHLAVPHAQRVLAAPPTTTFPVNGKKKKKANENRQAHTPSRLSATSDVIRRWKQQVLFGLFLIRFCIIEIAFTSQHCS